MAASITVNVRLPAKRNAEAPHLTRFQADAAPNLAGTTLLDLPASGADTVAALKQRVAGAPRRRARGPCPVPTRGDGCARGGGSSAARTPPRGRQPRGHAARQPRARRRGASPPARRRSS
jgi:hypothetical protein